MRKIVSFFGDRSALFTELNRRAEEYARSLDLEYRWVPQLPFSEEEWKDAIAKRVPAHTVDANLEAFERGRAAAQA